MEVVLWCNKCSDWDGIRKTVREKTGLFGENSQAAFSNYLNLDNSIQIKVAFLLKFEIQY